MPAFVPDVLQAAYISRTTKHASFLHDLGKCNAAEGHCQDTQDTQLVLSADMHKDLLRASSFLPLSQSQRATESPAGPIAQP